MKQLLTILLLFFTLTISAQTTVVTGPKKQQQTTAVDANKRKAEAEAAAKKRAEEAAAAKRKAEQAAANKKAEQNRQEKLRKDREEQARQEQLRREQAEQARQERLRQEQESARQRVEATRQKAEAEAREKAILLERARSYLDELANNMVYVEGGTFTMGTTPEQEKDSYGYNIVHTVKLSSFKICKYEITQDLWEVIMGNNPSKYYGAKKPVERVSWDDCQTFIKKLNWLTGKHYRLPTEAEWEFAARGGNKSLRYKYSGSNSLKKVACYTARRTKGTTHDVGQKDPNELGLYDMSGNVEEWCSDWYAAYSDSIQTNPTGPTTGSHRVSRGGSWNHAAWCSLVSSRFEHAPDCRYNNLGLRLVLVP